MLIIQQPQFYWWPVTYHGTSDGDVIVGHSLVSNTIWGYGGDDWLFGNVGNDYIMGGMGLDRIYAGDGNDVLDGDYGNDWIQGDGGNDVIAGDEGRDTLFGGTGDDQISGGDDDDTLSGGDGADTIHGDNGDDIIHGDGGNDTLVVGSGADHLYGDDGSDLFLVDVKDLGNGFTADGGSGSDMIALTGASGELAGFQLSSLAAKVDSVEHLSLWLIPGSADVHVKPADVLDFTETGVLEIQGHSGASVSLEGGWAAAAKNAAYSEYVAASGDHLVTVQIQAGVHVDIA
jgi:Ca2+-binding RTX toxin-like protein